MKFTAMEILLSVQFVSSFITIVLTSITWHKLGQQPGRQQSSLTDVSLKEMMISILQKFPVAPFFLSSILMKCFVTGTLASFLANRELQWVAIPLVIGLLIYQVGLQKLLGFNWGQVAIASFANLTTLAKPTTERKGTEAVHYFYVWETFASSGVYLGLSFVATFAFEITTDQEKYAAWACLVLSCLHLFITRVYLIWGKALLFPTLYSHTTSQHQTDFQAGACQPDQPEEDKPNVVTKVPAAQTPPAKRKLTICGWVLPVISCAITIGLIAFLATHASPEGNLIILKEKHMTELFHNSFKGMHQAPSVFNWECLEIRSWSLRDHYISPFQVNACLLVTLFEFVMKILFREG